MIQLDPQTILNHIRLNCPLCGFRVTREQGNGFVRARCAAPDCRFVQDVDLPRKSTPQAAPSVIVMPSAKIPAPTQKCRIPSCVGSITHQGEGQKLLLCAKHLAAWEYADKPAGKAMEEFVELYEDFEQDVTP